MADAIGVDPEIPVIVSERFHRHHTRLLEGADLFRERPLVVQSLDEILQCDELFVMQPGEFEPEWATAVAGMTAADAAGSASRRLYCRRMPTAAGGRNVENNLEIEELFLAAGFSVIDPAGMTIAEQKAAFQDAEIVAGVNGAAFANAVFRVGRPLTIGALISSNLLSSTVPTFAKVHGFRFIGHVVPATGTDRASPIVIPRETALRLIERLIQPSPA
jgi:capsular polysaccharide biosynthesis protein